MADKVRWGILGTGAIARKFAAGLTATPDAALVAVGSRTAEKANRFADEFNVPHRHASYQELADDPDVDAAYIATVNPCHNDNTILCLKARKAVLCEKPFAINARQAAAMIRTARKQKVFLMEAMWTRFFPAMRQVRKWLADGEIGEPRMVVADFGFRTGFNPESRLFNPALGGGGLLDVGIYAVSFASMVFGSAPKDVVSLANLGQSGIDEEAAIIFRYGEGRLALLYTAVRLSTPQAAHVLGTNGRIEMPPAFWHPTEAVLLVGDRKTRVEAPIRGNGYNYEAAEVARCLRTGLLESPEMPLDESLAIMKTMDRVRAQWGLKYPME